MITAKNCATVSLIDCSIPTVAPTLKLLFELQLSAASREPFRFVIPSTFILA